MSSKSNDAPKMNYTNLVCHKSDEFGLRTVSLDLLPILETAGVPGINHIFGIVDGVDGIYEDEKSQEIQFLVKKCLLDDLRRDIDKVLECSIVNKDQLKSVQYLIKNAFRTFELEHLKLFSDRRFYNWEQEYKMDLKEKAKK